MNGSMGEPIRGSTSLRDNGSTGHGIGHSLIECNFLTKTSPDVRQNPIGVMPAKDHEIDKTRERKQTDLDVYTTRQTQK